MNRKTREFIFYMLLTWSISISIPLESVQNISYNNDWYTLIKCVAFLFSAYQLARNIQYKRISIELKQDVSDTIKEIELNNEERKALLNESDYDPETTKLYNKAILINKALIKELEEITKID